MRDSIFGQSQPRGSVPNVPPPRDTGNRPVWNSGQVLQQGQSPGHYDQAPYGQGSYGQQPYGAPQGPMGGPMGGAFGGAMGGGGGSFLGTAAAAAAGVVGGSLLLNSIRSMMGGSRQAFGDTARHRPEPVERSIRQRSRARRRGQRYRLEDLAAQDRAQDLAQDRDDDNLAAQDRAQDLAQDRDDDSSRAGLFRFRLERRRSRRHGSRFGRLRRRRRQRLRLRRSVGPTKNGRPEPDGRFRF